MNRWFAALVVALFALAPARADVAPPPGQKRVPVTVVVEAGEDLPDYVFIEAGSRTYYGSDGPPTPGAPPERAGWRTDSWVNRVDLAPGRPVSSTGGTRDGGSLYAIPKAAAAGRDDNELIHAVNEGTVAGAARIGFGGSRELPTTDPRTEITDRYRVARTPAGVAFVKVEEPAGESGDDHGPAGRAVPWRWVVAGAAALAVALAGVWVVWRVRKGV